MKAVVMTALGTPDVLKLQEVPDPKISKSTEILVRLKAAGINPIDTKLRQRGTFFPDQMPAILGCDGSGIIEAVGNGVQNFRVGDQVYFCNSGLGSPPGNYAELAVVDERFVARKPASISFAEAASAPLVLITAWESLFDRGRLEAGQTTLIHAGAGGVGHVAIQLAKLRGAKVATTVSTAEKAVFVKQLGAEKIILYKQSEFVQETLDWTQGEGVDLAYDTIGGPLFEKTFPAVKVYGDLVSILSPDASVNWKVARDRNLRISLELMLTPMLHKLTAAQQHQADILRQCAEYIDNNQLTIHLGHTFPLAEAAEAHRLLESGSMTGKIALVMD